MPTNPAETAPEIVAYACDSGEEEWWIPGHVCRKAAIAAVRRSLGDWKCYVRSASDAEFAVTRGWWREVHDEAGGEWWRCEPEDEGAEPMTLVEL